METPRRAFLVGLPLTLASCAHVGPSVVPLKQPIPTTPQLAEIPDYPLMRVTTFRRSMADYRYSSTGELVCPVRNGVGPGDLFFLAETTLPAGDVFGMEFPMPTFEYQQACCDWRADKFKIERGEYMGGDKVTYFRREFEARLRQASFMFQDLVENYGGKIPVRRVTS